MIKLCLIETITDKITSDWNFFLFMSDWNYSEKITRPQS